MAAEVGSAIGSSAPPPVADEEDDEDDVRVILDSAQLPGGHASVALEDSCGVAAAAEVLGLVSPSSPSSGKRKERSHDALAIEPVLKQHHSGMFREQTMYHVMRVAEQIKTWGTAVKAEAPASANVLEVLEELADCVVDERVLEKTGIGRQVASLQKHDNQDVVKFAKTLVAQWKRDRETRNRVLKSFMEKAQLQKKDAKKLEEGLFYAACPLGYLEGEGYRSYHRHFLRLSTHLRQKGPGSLFQRLKEQEIDPLEVAFLPDEELLTSEQRLRAEADRRAGLDAVLAAKGAEHEGTVTSEYMCPKCSSTHTLYKEVQTGWHNDQQDATIMVQCLDCNERWKASDDHGGGG